MKFRLDHKVSWIFKATLSKKKNVERITMPDLRYIRATAICKNVWYCHKNRHVGQWNKAEDPNMTTRNYSYVAFDKIVKNTLEKGKHLQQMSKKQYINMQKKEISSISITLNKNEL